MYDSSASLHLNKSRATFVAEQAPLNHALFNAFTIYLYKINTIAFRVVYSRAYRNIFLRPIAPHCTYLKDSTYSYRYTVSIKHAKCTQKRN